MFGGVIRRSEKQQTAFPSIPFKLCAAKTTLNGKPGTLVIDHCIDVGRVSEVLYSFLPRAVRSRLPASIGLSTSIHDVGKISPGYALKYFENSIVREYAPALCGQRSFSTHHASISAAAVDRWLGSTIQMQSPVARAVAAHHGKIDIGYPLDTSESAGGTAWAEERRKLIENLSSVFDGKLSDSKNANPWLLAGLTCVSDWIGSDEVYFPADRPSIEGSDVVLTAHRAVAECGFRPSMIKKGMSFNQIFGFSPRPAQQQFIDKISAPGLYILEAPMGIGKTEAALYAAYRLMESGSHHGFYFALPTRLTSDRIYERVMQFLATITDKSTIPKLAHGMAWLNNCQWGNSDEKNRVHPWFNPSKRALLYPYAVGTIDQALLSVLNVKHSFVRLYGLSGKVVILDEVHSYDMYTGTLLDELVERLLSVGCTVIILSATLTGVRRNRLAPALSALKKTDDYPLMTGMPTDGRLFASPLIAPALKEISVRMEPWNTLRIAEEAIASARRGECVVCIANTVAKAQAWYCAVKSAMPSGAFPVGILHARFPMFQRQKIEDEWMVSLGKNSEHRPHGCVLIATQIVEQSVDIDADWMISELAPTDMLLQRMGRLWRHDRSNRICSAPEFVIVTKDPTMCSTVDDVFQAFGKENACVYDPYVLMRSHTVWKPLHTVVLPSNIRTLIEDTYTEQADPSESLMGLLKQRLEERCEHLRKLACSAKDTNLGFPTSEDDEHAATRYSDLPTKTVLLLADEPETLPQGGMRVRLLDGSFWRLNPYVPDFAATKALHASTVSVACHLLPNRGNIRQNTPWLDRHFFDKPVVLLCKDGGVLNCFSGTETILRYSPEFGIWRSDKPQENNAPNEPSVAYTEDGTFDSLKTDW